MKAARISGTLVALASTGCVSRQAPSPDWPAPAPLRSLSQLGGVYKNEGEGGGAYARSLYDLLVGQLGTSNAKGAQTELKPSADGKSLQVLLRDLQGRVLESTLLREKDDFVVGKKGVSMKVPSNVGATGVTNLGVFAASGSVVVKPSANGGLLGRQGESGAGFLFFLIPIAGSEEQNYYWPVLTR